MESFKFVCVNWESGTVSHPVCLKTRFTYIFRWVELPLLGAILYGQVEEPGYLTDWTPHCYIPEMRPGECSWKSLHPKEMLVWIEYVLIITVCKILLVKLHIWRWNLNVLQVSYQLMFLQFFALFGKYHRILES